LTPNPAMQTFPAWASGVMDVFAAPARSAIRCRLNIKPARNKTKAVCLNRRSEITAFLSAPLSVAENQIEHIQPALGMKIEPSVTGVDANA
jgi:hypothetical protein